MSPALTGILAEARIAPVMTVPGPITAVPLARALAAGGTRCAEVTLRTPDAGQVVKAMAAHGALTVGAGTVHGGIPMTDVIAVGEAMPFDPGHGLPR
ncbi:hypothetical protein [Streptomyces sp. NPDC006668]|uniref:hypothetical protein n=1 Tax=Streptomyces sp. NPDC006668 TaxID=3156903 RepID=UPI0033FD2553